jgi:protein phosphatase
MRPIDLPEPCLIVLIGAAGSGKTTFAARHFDPDEVLASDAYRERITGDAADQRASGLAFRFLHDDLARRAAEGRTTVVDATNVAPHARRVLLGRARDAAMPVVAIVLDLPQDVVQARNAARARVVPGPVVADQLARLRVALDATSANGLHAEGFDLVVILTDPAVVDAIRFVRRR